MPPGSCLVLTAGRPTAALWVTLNSPMTKHAWPGALLCTLFRNEGLPGAMSSELVLQAVAASAWRYGAPAAGMVTFVNPKLVRASTNPGYCFLRAGFRRAGHTKARGLLALHLPAEDFPPAQPPLGATADLF